MSEINDIPAFPNKGTFDFERGMTLRDYFAAKAMQALITTYKDDPNVSDEVGERAYYYADMMLMIKAEDE